MLLNFGGGGLEGAQVVGNHAKGLEENGAGVDVGLALLAAGGEIGRLPGVVGKAVGGGLPKMCCPLLLGVDWVGFFETGEHEFGGGDEGGQGEEFGVLLAESAFDGFDVVLEGGEGVEEVFGDADVGRSLVKVVGEGDAGTLNKQILVAKGLAFLVEGEGGVEEDTDFELGQNVGLGGVGLVEGLEGAMDAEAAVLSVGEAHTDGVVGQIDFAVVVVGLGMDVDADRREKYVTLFIV